MRAGESNLGLQNGMSSASSGPLAGGLRAAPLGSMGESGPPRAGLGAADAARAAGAELRLGAASRPANPASSSDEPPDSPVESPRRPSRNWTRSACTRILERFSPVLLSSQVSISERAFDVDSASFPQTLAADLSLAIPDGDIDEELLLAALALLRHPRAAGDQPQLAHRRSGWECGVARGQTSNCPSRKPCSSRPCPILLAINLPARFATAGGRLP